MKKKLTKFNYNINGSRALAVLLVFIFHLNSDYITGGYIGVDIFFVISGYVISQSLLDIYRNKKNFFVTSKIFFKKRILRILPAIIILSTLSLFIFNFIFIEKHYLSFLNSVIPTNIFISNFFFWNESGYFGLENSFKPLLHTWSLSVEIQVYLVLPLLLFFLFKKRYLSFYFLVLLATFLSIFMGEIFINRPFVYFFPFFRVHEFLFGTLIFYYLNYISKKKINYLYSYIGIIVIIFSSIYLNEYSQFPGINSLLPLIGISLIIISEDKKNIILNNNFTQFLGNISYSFYLYHWPVIVAFKYIFLKTFFNLSDVIIIFALTSFLSFISYRFIELNFKYLKSNKIFNSLLIIVFLLTISYSLNLQKKNSIESKENDFFTSEIEIRNSFLNKVKNNNKSQKKKLYIIGDSHAQDIFITLSHDTEILKKYSKIYIHLNDNCLRYVQKKSWLIIIENFITELVGISKKNVCDMQVKRFLEISKHINHSDILISNRWSINTVNHIEKAFNNLLINKNNLILTSRRPLFFDIPSLLEIKDTLNYLEFNKLAYELRDRKINKINDLIQNKVTFNKLKYLDIENLICEKSNSKCDVMNEDSLLFIDKDHFSMTGSKFFSNKIALELKKLLNK